LIAAGPGVARASNAHANIVDCAPTILAMLGLRIPDDMQGRVIHELFERPPTIEYEAAQAAHRSVEKEEVYSAHELQQVTDRLSDLGYLE
jgi:arylsulfatase A-like enzyme